MFVFHKEKKMKKIVLGIIIILGGSLMLGFNHGFIDDSYRHIVYSWQMLLIAIGIVELFDKERFATGIILLLVGGAFMIKKLVGYDEYFMKAFWPTLIILFGLMIIFRNVFFKNRMKFFKREMNCDSESNVDKLEEINIFGGSKKRYNNKKFKGGSMINIFGGSELNLYEADLEPGPNVLECVNIFGGMVLIVPNDWTIRLEMVSVFGGFADKRHHYDMNNADKILVIKGVSIFGGGEIKN